jgi:hypothetical protein
MDSNYDLSHFIFLECTWNYDCGGLFYVSHYKDNLKDREEGDHIVLRGRR